MYGKDRQRWEKREGRRKTGEVVSHAEGKIRGRETRKGKKNPKIFLGKRGGK